MPIDPDIRKSETLPSSFYFSDSIWEACRKKIFASSWQWIGDNQQIFEGSENIYPFTLHDDYLDDPLLLVKATDGQVECLSNVCTHRGFILHQSPAKAKKLLCKYHGRRFSLQGRFECMPEFQETEEFPRECDHLAKLPVKQWRQFLFTNLHSGYNFETVFGQMKEKVGFLPIEKFEFRPEFTKVYPVKAHWALYCDNFLEGFHIPFVHETLNNMLDYGSYNTEILDHMVLQTGYGDDGTPTFDLPEGHVDLGKNVTAYYYWIFPNIMFNFYPWGLQVNVVQPVSKSTCNVVFYHYLFDESVFKKMDALHVAEKTQREDEFVVEAVQKGLGSRYYHTGRFSPKREKGVHYFHRLISEYLDEKA